MTKPLLNRALMGVYPPGSTFKTAQGLTFLQEGIITEQSPAFPCSHGFHYGRLTVGCHAHGSPLPLIPAIATKYHGNTHEENHKFHLVHNVDVF